MNVIVESPVAATERKPGALTNKQRFLNACACLPVDRPPVWLMRQAGRCLPEYRALKEKYSFLKLVQTPELAAEVTLQPIRRFDFDAAILFSDILVVAEAMGQGYHFREKGGVEMEFPLRTAEDIERLQPEAVVERLQYVAGALPIIKDALGSRTALLGFAGSPWTLANFMLEGGSAKEYARAKQMFFMEPALFELLSAKLTEGVTAFLQLQIDSGVDAIQIFDSLAGALPGNAYERASGRWIRQIISGLNGGIPVIVFAKGCHSNWGVLVDTGAHVLGIDWTLRLADLRTRVPASIGIQGNLDPFLLTATPQLVAAETRSIMNEMRKRDGYIFNLGHGVPPNAKLENIEAVVATVRGEL
jgi:uroporphyrinogen decarboxylase